MLKDNIKKSCFFALMICFTVVFSSCSRHTPDTNGRDDFSVTSFSLHDIISGSSCVKNGASKVKKGDVTDIKVKKFSGVDNIHKFQLNGAALELTVAANVQNGNLKVVLCNDSEVLKEFFVNKGAQTIQVPAMSDTLYLKVAGESATYSLSYKYDITKSKAVFI